MGRQPHVESAPISHKTGTCFAQKTLTGREGSDVDPLFPRTERHRIQRLASSHSCSKLPRSTLRETKNLELRQKHYRSSCKRLHHEKNEPRLQSNSSNHGQLAMGGPKKRILVIDDQQVFLRSIAAVLRSLGYAVKTVAEGFSGIELLQREKFDLVIVDMIMPEVGGLVVMEVIRQEHPKIPILAISGHYDKLLNAVKAADIHGILPKPVRLKTLEITLNNVFSKKTRPPSRRPDRGASNQQGVPRG